MEYFLPVMVDKHKAAMKPLPLDLREDLDKQKPISTSTSL